MVGLLDGLRAKLPAEMFALLEEAADICHAKGWKLYIVGGRVRDLILRRPGLDIDLVIEGNALDLAKELAERHSAGLTAHQRFKTASIQFNNYSLDVVTARSESYTSPGALPEVVPGSLEDDLKRRDFSINAMAVSLNRSDFGTLIDPSGGRLDMEKGLIRILHPQSFSDDATRIFRAIRYEQRFGFNIEPKTLACLIEHKKYLATITPERLRYEFECIFREAFPEKALKRAGDLSVLSQVNDCFTFGCRESNWFKQARDICQPETPSFSLYLALTCSSFNQTEIQKLAARLSLTAGDFQILHEGNLLNSRLGLLDCAGLRASALYRLLSNYDQVAITACMITNSKPAVKKNLGYYLKTLQYIKPELDGHEVKLLGVPHGPRVGEVLQIVHDAKLDGLVKTRQDETSLVRNLISKNSGV